MAKFKVGAAVVALMFAFGAGADSLPQQDARKPMASNSVDGGVKSIRGYSTRDQAEVSVDGEFLRRVMLDIVGYPPTGEQVKAFYYDKNENKRAAKIAELLDTPDYADHWARKFASVFFGDYHNVPMDTMPKLAGAASSRIVNDFISWMTRRLEKDSPWTDIVFAMIDARGSDEGDPALAYHLSFYKGEGYPIEFADGMAQHLLGIRLLCARCHDHPFDQWKVEDYFNLASFAVRQRATGYGNSGEKDAVNNVKVIYRNDGEMEIKRSPDANDKTSKVRLAQGGTASPKFLFGGAAGPNDDRMRILAKLMTMKANTQVPRALANRVWGFLFGTGIVDPVDDFNQRNRPSSSSLLETLTKELINNDYSLKHLLKVICNSDTYQRACASQAEHYKTTFAAAPVQPLTGEQLVNSILVATTGKPGKDHKAEMEMVSSLFPAGAIWCEVTPLPSNARQALLLRNNQQVSGWIGSGGVLSKIKGMSGDDSQKVVEIFLAALSRLPSEQELARYVAFVKANPGTGWDDAYWTLMNTTEFVTKH